MIFKVDEASEELPQAEVEDQLKRSTQSIQDQNEDSIDDKKIITPVKPFERLSSRFPDINKDCYEMVKCGQKKAYQCLKCDKQCRTYCGIREHHYSQVSLMLYNISFSLAYLMYF